MKKSFVDNAADKKQVKSAVERETRNENRRKNDIRSIGELLEGRRYLWQLMEKCGLNESILYEPNAMYFRAGERNVGIRVRADIIEAAPEMYFKMQKESSEGIYDA